MGIAGASPTSASVHPRNNGKEVPEDALQTLGKVLEENRTLTLVTHGPEGLWAGKVYFAEHKGYLYVALEQGKNFRNIQHNPEVVFVIERGKPDRFIQGKGIIEEIGPIEEVEERHILFRKVFEVVPFARMIPGVKLFRIRPTELYISDFTGEWKPRTRLQVDDALFQRLQKILVRPPALWKTLLQATRFWIFSMTVLIVGVGTALAWWQTGQLHWGWAGLTLLAALLVHAGVNVISDWSDYIRGADQWFVLGSSRVLVDRMLSPRVHLLWGISLFLMAGVLGGIIAYVRVPELLWFMIAGAFLGLFYTLPPLGLKYRALGDIAVFLAFGPLMVAGVWLIQTTSLEGIHIPLLAGIPIGFLTTAILHGNNYRDMEVDRKAGYRTMAIWLGPRGSAYYYAILIFLAYLSQAVLVTLGYLPIHTALTLLALPFALRNIRTAFHTTLVAFTMLDMRTGQLHQWYTLFLLLGIILGGLFPISL